MSPTGTNIAILLALTLVALSATTVVFTTDPARQAVTLSAFGLILSVLFFLLEPPDVSLAELAVGAAVVPLMVMLALRRTRRQR